MRTRRCGTGGSTSRFAEQQFGEADLAARPGDVVHRDETRRSRPSVLSGSASPGGAQIGELGFAARSPGTWCA